LNAQGVVKLTVKLFIIILITRKNISAGCD